MSNTPKLPFIHYCFSAKLYEKGIEWPGFAWPLRCHHPKCNVQFMLFEYICDNGTNIFFIQLLSADIHHFGLSTHKPDQRALMTKVTDLKKIIQPITV